MGHLDTSIMTRMVKVADGPRADEAAEQWGRTMVSNKFGEDEVEIIKVTITCLE